MYANLSTNTWVTIRDDCPITCDVNGSGEADFTCGTPPDCFEFTIEAEALRQFAALASEALSDMDARFAQEEAERTHCPQ
ncbi:hypothetical protein [Actinokineospora sp.]|uniref:hypothetical protein n=1 Tax=Actinokineospora sp. TaxID=1872133 RepID=UPI004037FA3B